MSKNLLKDYFSYSRRERRGIILLLVIILIILIAYLLLPVIHINQKFNLKKYKSKIEDFEKSLKPENKQKLYNIKLNQETDSFNRYQLFRFNPNTIDINDLERLGFNEYAIKNIIKYRNKGGYFCKKEDLLKIYGMDTSLFYRLAHLIYFNNNSSNKNYEGKHITNPVNKNQTPVNINAADTHLISELLGGNNLFSERIIKYRNLLGGFVNENQLNEIYGLHSNQYNLIINNVIIDTTIIRKININKADEQILNTHPYLNKYYARAIIKYRNFTGGIKNVNELLINNILPENIFFKIRQYLSVN